MDAHRLGSVFDLIIAEHNRLAIDHKFAQILQTLGACIANPSSSSDEQFRAALTALLSALRRSRSNDLVESDRRILIQINGDRFTGDGLADRVLGVANERPFLPGRAKEEYVRLGEDLASYLSTLAAAQSSLRQLNVEPTRFSGDDFELGILLPERVGTGDLAAVMAEFTAWDQALKDLMPAFSDKAICVSLRNLSSGHFELKATIDRDGALALGSIIGGIYDLYRKVDANRRNADELGRQNYPPEIVTQIKEYEQHIIQLELKAIKETVARGIKGKGNRRKEAERALERGLRFLTVMIREGVELEIVGPTVFDLSENGDVVTDDFTRRLPHHVRAAVRTARHQNEAPQRAEEERDAPRLPLSHLTGSDDQDPAASPASSASSAAPQQAA